MKHITHIDVPMHGVGPGQDRSYFPYQGYFKWTQRTYYYRGVAIWSRKLDHRECDPYELVRRI